MMQSLSFKQFMELNSVKPDYLSTIQDELGIDPEDLQKVPQIAANFKLGDTYNLGTISVVGFENDSSGKPVLARVKLMHDPTHKTQKRFKSKKDQYYQVDNSDDNEKTYLVPIEKLNSIMTQGMQQPAAGMGGLPGGGLTI